MDQHIREKDTEIAALNIQIQGIINQIHSGNQHMSSTLDKLIMGTLKGRGLIKDESLKIFQEIREDLRDLDSQIQHKIRPP